jgi:hypothetical protein
MMQYIDEYEPETTPMTLEELDCLRPPENVVQQPPPEAKYDLHYIWSQFMKTVKFEYEEPEEEETENDDDDDSFLYEEHYDETAELEEDTEPETDPDEVQLPGWTKQEDGWVVKVGNKKIVNVAK